MSETIGYGCGVIRQNLTIRRDVDGSRLLRQSGAGFRMRLGPSFGSQSRNLALLEIGQASEHVGQILGRVDLVSAASSNNRIDARATPTRLWVTDEQEGLLSDRGRPN